MGFTLFIPITGPAGIVLLAYRPVLHYIVRMCTVQYSVHCTACSSRYKVSPVLEMNRSFQCATYFLIQYSYPNKTIPINYIEEKKRNILNSFLIIGITFSAISLSNLDNQRLLTSPNVNIFLFLFNK